MKKFVAILLVVVMLLSFASCGAINKSQVAVIWANTTDSYLSSLKNAFDRAFYIENIDADYYDSENSKDKQLDHIITVLGKDCSVLLVNLVDGSNAQEIVNLAKAKDVPIVFFESNVSEDVINSYEKCYSVDTDSESLNAQRGQLIGNYFSDKKVLNQIDRNDDGKITYAVFGSADAKLFETAGTVMDAYFVKEELGEKETKELVPFDAKVTSLDSATAEKQVLELFKTYNDEHKNTIEIIITEDDATALSVVKALQSKGFNSDKLKTHLIPVFTVGAYEDAKAFADMSAMKEEEKAEYIYTTTNMVDAGLIAGTAMKDFDSQAIAVSVVARNIIEGNEIMTDIAEKTVIGEKSVKIPYMSYAG